MGPMRRCSKTGCQSPALATLTYNYADSQVVIGPLAQRAEPHTYDLCAEHARRTTAPRGWEVLRLELPEHYETTAPDGTVHTVPTAPRAVPAAEPSDVAPRPARTAPRVVLSASAAGDDEPAVPRPPARPGLRLVRDDD
ncbi:DUF3499 domain-containing protein [Micrococcus endophyticus]